MADRDAILERWAGPLLPALVLVAAIALGFLRGPGSAILALAAGVLVLLISLLWQSLRVAFGETALSIAVQHIKSEAEPLQEVRHDLPAGLCRIVHR